MNASDWGALKGPLIVLLAIVAAGVGMIYYLDQSLDTARRELLQQQNQLRDARTRLHKSGDEKNIIVRYMSDYQYLERLGFAGDERRLNWLEGLRLANQKMRLFGVDYDIGSQQPYPYANELALGQLTMHQSIMRVKLGLLHEGDLMGFLETLARQGAGVFSVNQCTLDRIDTGGSIRFQPNLRAECELAWITIRPVQTDKKS